MLAVGLFMKEPRGGEHKLARTLTKTRRPPLRASGITRFCNVLGSTVVVITSDVLLTGKSNAIQRTTRPELSSHGIPSPAQTEISRGAAHCPASPKLAGMLLAIMPRVPSISTG